MIGTILGVKFYSLFLCSKLFLDLIILSVTWISFPEEEYQLQSNILFWLNFSMRGAFCIIWLFPVIVSYLSLNT